MKRPLLFLLPLAVATICLGLFVITDFPDSRSRISLDSRALVRTSDTQFVVARQNTPFDQAAYERALYNRTRRLLPLAQPLGAPKRGEWRSVVKEPQQNFSQYASEPDRVSATGKTALLIQPIGNLPLDQRRAVGHVTEALGAFFGLSVRCSPPLPLSSIPSNCFRGSGSRRQINAEALMSNVLRPMQPPDVAATLALTSLGLFPGDRWQFDSTLGWSSFHEGTSILSTDGILGSGAADRGENVARLIKISAHELCHTFTLKHCSTHNCLMNGCSGLDEIDKKPLTLCPDCLAKLSLALNRDPAEHLSDMYGLTRAKGFSAESRYYHKAVQLIK